MRDIAEEAAVAVQTIYASIGSKRSLLSAFIDQMEEDAEVQNAVRETEAAGSPGELLAIRARASRRIFGAGFDMIEFLARSAGTAPEIREALEEGDRRHYESVRLLVTGRLSDGVLREGLTLDEATDIIATLSGSDVYRWLVGRYGWSPEAYERWLARSLREAVLRDPSR
jgi:AcrR family transcriptional regulator